MRLWRYGRAIEQLGGRYRLDGTLGSGGMADVCLAWDEREEREVAIKVIKPDELSQKTLDRFLKEAAQIAKWNHPNILRVYSDLRLELLDAVQGSIVPYIVMEYAQGGDLQKRLRPGAPYSLPETLDIFAQLCRAVSYAHAQGIIHRDLKPLNILFRRLPDGIEPPPSFGARLATSLYKDDGSTVPMIAEQVVLSDFGLAVEMDATHHTFARAGTLPYMAPEQFRGKVEGASDIYALGVILYQLCTGRLPYKRSLHDLNREEPLPMPARPSHVNPDLPPALDDVIFTALAENPRQRYVDASRFWQSVWAAMLPRTRARGGVHTVWSRTMRAVRPSLNPDQPGTDTPGDVTGSARMPEPMGEQSQGRIPSLGMSGDHSSGPSLGAIESQPTGESSYRGSDTSQRHEQESSGIGLDMLSRSSSSYEHTGYDQSQSTPLRAVGRTGDVQETPRTHMPPLPGHPMRTEPLGDADEIIELATRSLHRGNSKVRKSRKARNEQSWTPQPQVEGTATYAAYQPRPLRVPRLKRYLGIVLPLSLILTLVMISIIFLVPGGISRFFPGLLGNARITITPIGKQMKQTYTVTALEHPNMTKPEVALRPLVLSLDDEQEIKGMGVNQTAGKRATGKLTFSNGAFAAQTITEGTVITSVDGVKVIVDSTISLPARDADSGIAGSATIPAHAADTGVKGNITELNINKPCCVASGAIFVKNTEAFTGGEDPVGYTFVQQRDVDAVVKEREKPLAEQAQVKMQAQLMPQEHMIGDVSCSSSVNTGFPIGDKGPQESATSTSVMLTTTCQGQAYDSVQLEVLVSKWLEEAVTAELGQGYALSGRINTQVTIASRSDLPEEQIQLNVEASGLWSYQLSKIQQDMLARLIAGKTQTEAASIIRQHIGVQDVAIESSSEILPTESWAIHINVKN